VTKKGERLFVQVAGQPEFEIFPRSETEFFLKEANATILFVKNDKGEVVKLILRQSGMEFEGTKTN
jgi:hypothetical protein